MAEILGRHDEFLEQDVQAPLTPDCGAVELAVEPQEVVLGQAEATDWCGGFQATMWSVPIVAMKPVDQFGGALI